MDHAGYGSCQSLCCLCFGKGGAELMVGSFFSLGHACEANEDISEAHMQESGGQLLEVLLLEAMTHAALAQHVCQAQ